MEKTSQKLVELSGLITAKVNHYANYGILTAIIIIIVSTFAVTYLNEGEITILGLGRTHIEISALWILDLTPIIFALWGQTFGRLMAFEAGALLIDQTSALRNKATALEVEVHRGITLDRLTDLPNRLLFHDRIEQALTAAERRKGRIAVLVMDVDDFKEVNSTLGHFLGDVLLKLIASRLKSAVRGPDSVARLGSDEFAVLLTELANENDAVLVANKLCKLLEPCFVLGGVEVDIQVSVGVAIYPVHGDDVDILLQKADVAMYTAKQTSGFAVELYSHEHDRHSQKKLTLIGELRKAIENEELTLHYQPKVNIGNRVIEAVESLVRWKHPQYGMMPPEEFINLAERTGLIRPLTYWVIREAMRQWAEWSNQGHMIDIAVNLSANVLLDPELPSIVDQAMSDYGVEKRRLTLEITESSLMDDQEAALRVLNQFGSQGIRISIDDFGTGYSSLAYLRRLPVNEIKIDKSFVMGMVKNANDHLIVRATIGLAHNLGMSVIAEGVADETTWNRLANLGCDIAQGFYVSEPADGDAIMKLLRQYTWKKKQ